MTRRSGPVLQLISEGLKLWIRSRCDSIAELQLQLHGSGLGLLQGKLEGVSLVARDAVFQGLPLQRVDLSSGPIQVSLSSGGVVLQQSFSIDGDVSMTGRGLNKALLAEPWRWLGDWLSEQLMGLSPLGGLTIDDDVLELQAPVVAHKDPARRRFHVRADQNTMVIVPIAGGGETLLPMDPGIRIESASLKAGLLHLKGHADVKP